MNPMLLVSILIAVFSVGLFVQAAVFYWHHDDHSCTYRLYAVRDKIIRLNVEGKIARNDPYYDALYQNVSMLLQCSRFISGPDGWPRAEIIGQHLARRPQDAAVFARMPSRIPPPLVSVIDELRAALQHLITNHFGVYLQMDASRRERSRIQKEQARKLLAQIPNSPCRV